MNKQSKKLLPFIEFNESDVINMYALDGFGEKGTFVKVSGTPNVDDAVGVIGDAGVVLDGTLSPMWGSKLKVTPITSGDRAAAVVGVMLKNVFQYDENGELLKFHKRKRIELDSVNSGEAVPLLTRATILTLGTGAYTGTATVGNVIVPEDGGKVKVVAPGSVDASFVLGSVIGLTNQFTSTGIVVKFK